MTEDIVLGITAPEDDGQTPLDSDEARGLLPDWIATCADLDVAEEQNIATGMVGGCGRCAPRISQACVQPMRTTTRRRLNSSVVETACCFAAPPA